MSSKLSDLNSEGNTTRSNSFLNSQEDITWLLETHLKSCEELEWIKQNIKSFIICGNEDFPEFIECYSETDPVFGTKPFFKMVPDKEGEYK